VRAPAAAPEREEMEEDQGHPPGEDEERVEGNFEEEGGALAGRDEQEADDEQEQDHGVDDQANDDGEIGGPVRLLLDRLRENDERLNQLSMFDTTSLLAIIREHREEVLEAARANVTVKKAMVALVLPPVDPTAAQRRSFGDACRGFACALRNLQSLEKFTLICFGVHTLDVAMLIFLGSLRQIRDFHLCLVPSAMDTDEVSIPFPASSASLPDLHTLQITSHRSAFFFRAIFPSAHFHA